MATLSIKNWKKFQHFKDRRPPWIKLYRDILDDLDWHELSGDDAKHLVMLWLIASEMDGYLPDIRTISFRLRIDIKTTESLILRLNHWVSLGDIAPISDRYQSDAPETETETETETEAGANAPLPPERSEGLVDLGSSLPSTKTPRAGRAKEYAFEAGVIRLVEKDFKEWEKAFTHLDLRAELIAIAGWAGKQQNWFHAVPNALAKRNREAKAAADAAAMKAASGATKMVRGLKGDMVPAGSFEDPKKGVILG